MNFFKAIFKSTSIYKKIHNKLIFLFLCVLSTSSLCIAEDSPGSSNTTLIPSLSPPYGQCALSKENVHEGIIISRPEKKYAGKYKVLMVFADCKDIEALRQGKNKKIKSYGEFLLPIKNHYQFTNVLEQDLPDPIELNELIKEITRAETLT